MMGYSILFPTVRGLAPNTQVSLYAFNSTGAGYGVLVVISITPDLALDEGYTYAGGLGVLEGDKFYAAARLGLDYVVLTLFYRGGYVDYEFHNGEPVPKPQKHPRSFIEKLFPEDEFTVRIRGEEVIVKPWVYRYGTARAVFFEAVCPMWARKLTERIYIEDNLEERFYKYTLLAKASAYYVENVIGVDNIDYVDLQEAYTALLTLLLPVNHKYRIIIHTPGPWGHPTFPRELIEKEFGWSLTTPQVVLTEIGLTLAKEAFVVSRKQLDVIKHVFPHHVGKIRYVTNGVDVERWTHPEIKKVMVNGEVDMEKLWEAHLRVKEQLLALLGKYKDFKKDPSRMIIVWARRITRYKRPYFIARFIEELGDKLDAMVVLAGKPHPHDDEGKGMLRWFKKLHDTYPNVVLVHDYDVSKAKLILAGGDLLLFTPFSGWEACGTSYMKAGLNGVPTLSSRDGGVLELIEDGVNGWLFGEDIRSFINIYENPRVRGIDEKEYAEFKGKLTSIIKTYYNRVDDYMKVSYNAFRTFKAKADIANTLRGYYPDLLGSRSDER